MNKKDINSFLSRDFLIFSGIFISIITLTLFFKIIKLDYQFYFSIAIIPIILGLLFEQKRLSYSWKEILVKLFSAYSVFVVIFLIYTQNHDKIFSKEETKNLIAIFALCYLSISIAYSYYIKENKRITPKITEGIILLQSLSVIYFLAEFGFFESFNLFKTIIFLPFAIYSLISIYQCLTNKIPTDKIKLQLSIWSSLIYLIFSVNFLIYILFNDLKLDLKNSLLFFLYGISLIYTAQNFWLLIRFLPEKGETANNYKKRTRQLRLEHINRYLNDQVSYIVAIISLIIISSIYYLNYINHWINGQSLIWFVLCFYPIIINLLTAIYSRGENNKM